MALYYVASFGQPTAQFVKVVVAPDHADWTYHAGDRVKFTITVLQNGNPLHDVRVRYEIGPERLEPTQQKENVVLAKGTTTIRRPLQSRWILSMCCRSRS